MIRLAVALSIGLATQALSQELGIGLAGPPTSFDPHYHAHAQSQAVQRHVFEPMISRATDLALQPNLAKDWVLLPDGEGWEFHLDPAAQFSDGTPVTAADVAASLHRALTLPSPGRWTPFLGDITGVEVLDDHTLRMRAKGPAPLLPANVTVLMIVPARIAQTARTADFNAGTAAIGSGPYRLRRYEAGESVELAADPGWWQAPRQGAEPWSRVTLRVVANDASRVASLLARDLDLIEAVPPADAVRIAERADMRVMRASSFRTVYIALDQHDVAPPGLTTRQGAAPASNPLADRRVRRALSLAIDRASIVARVMDGEAVVANQLQPDSSPSTDPTIPPPAFDPAAARRLLAEAGWAEGFRMVLGGPNNRLVNDERILQAVAQMWERIGISVTVEAQPMAVYLPRFVAGGYPSALASWSSTSQDPNSFFSATLATRERSSGRGIYNPTGYGNPALDALMDEALRTLDIGARRRIWQRATHLALVDDIALLPLHHQNTIWAMRRGLRIEPRAEEATYAMGVRAVTP